MDEAKEQQLVPPGLIEEDEADADEDNDEADMEQSDGARKAGNSTK